MRNPLKELYNANDAVEHSIDRLEFEGRSAVSRDVVGYLRHLVEHIAMYATYGNRPIEGDYFKLGSVRPGLTYMCPHGAISLTP